MKKAHATRGHRRADEQVDRDVDEVDELWHKMHKSTRWFAIALLP